MLEEWRVAELEAARGDDEEEGRGQNSKRTERFGFLHAKDLLINRELPMMPANRQTTSDDDVSKV